jgi:hypothetical protein
MDFGEGGCGRIGEAERQAAYWLGSHLGDLRIPMWESKTYADYTFDLDPPRRN